MLLSCHIRQHGKRPQAGGRPHHGKLIYGRSASRKCGLGGGGGGSPELTLRQRLPPWWQLDLRAEFRSWPPCPYTPAHVLLRMCPVKDGEYDCWEENGHLVCCWALSLTQYFVSIDTLLLMKWIRLCNKWAIEDDHKKIINCGFFRKSLNASLYFFSLDHY